MKIAGLQKMTLLDFPGKVACTVFLDGCNFRCPFCHNTPLLQGSAQPFLTTEEFFAFLKKRQGILDGVCVTGGEPTLQKDLPEFLGKIKQLGYPVKLDTNGYRPDVLQSLIEQKLVDYVAMDIKNSPERYSETAGVPIDLEKIEKSIKLLAAEPVDYEFRTTVAQPLHDAQSIESMGRWLIKTTEGKLVKAHYLQAFVARDTVWCSELSAPSVEALEMYKASLVHAAKTVGLRGV